MRNFRKVSLRVLLIVGFIYVFNAGVRFAYEPANNNLIYTNKDLKKSEGEIETLILGTSLLHWGLSGQTLGKALDSTTFNLATSAQPLDGSYYLLKDQVKRNPIKRVFLGVHVSSMTNNSNKWIHLREGIFDRIHSPIGKLEYMWETAKLKEYEVYLFYPARVENVLTKKMVTKNIKYKLSEDFRDNIPPKSQTYKYKGMGDESSDKIFNGKIPKNKQGSGYVWDRNKILDANRENLGRIADYCREQGIELNLVIAPVSQAYSGLIGDLEDMHLFYQEFCDENQAALYDFNQYENVYETLTPDCYQDEKHLNAKGAVLLAQMLGDWYM